ncbi:hypothetical protein [Oceanobacillus jeddahense]|uniref:Uncharacterized protein n=1 Tax=Oceanobacillus jeddahense TaxID=1462527 RepID=A0ABY5JS63_9BACI|nr:hypothetical protein [Oceanobacillus jeddahense]UUI03074.1 hypothetical protein NP439_24105 [Oceanobacillus jeddahense]
METKLKIDWSNFIITVDMQSSSNYIDFEISPEDFLNYAIDDLKTQDVKGRVNCLTNCKRAIDSQIDWLISYLGLDYTNFNEKKYLNLKRYMKDINNEVFSSDTSFKIKFIQIMGIAPMLLVSKIRSVRNKLEHQYKIPEYAECQEALELAELFINSTQNKMWDKKWTNFYIESNNSNVTSDIAISYETFNTDDPYIEVRTRGEEDPTVVKFYPSQKDYLELLYISINHKFTRLPQFFECSMEAKYIHYEIKNG